MSPDQAASPMMSPLIPLMVIFLIWYVLILKPQKEKQKKNKEMLGAVKKNDAIVTFGGMHGTVVHVKDKTIVVRVDDNVKIEFDKTAISQITKQAGG